jgi:5-methylcytosine-specific restriction enzyme subunit McrC
MLEGEENSELPNELRETVDQLIHRQQFSSQTENSPVRDIKAFGLNNEFNNRWCFGYYIGLDYIDDHDPDTAVLVKPKIENLDYWAMFEICLRHPETNRYMPSVYDIRAKKPWIKIGYEKSRNFSLIIIYHFLSLLKSLVKKPLIKSYVNKTENLAGKIKGKIQLARHFKKNTVNNRHDRVYCSFDEYTADCPANRLLHSAIKICVNYIKRFEKGTAMYKEFTYMEPYFQNIGYITSSAELSGIKTNSLFFEYKEALRIAGIIYRIKSYNEETKTETKFQKIPPFVIDMPKLFELYAFAQMKDAGLNVSYQQAGNYGTVDFLVYDKDNPIIIDTKYKKLYDNEEYNIDDIRQVSGYARDIRLLKNLYGSEYEAKINSVPKCLIIYPGLNESDNKDIPRESSALLTAKIKHFNEFYKYGITIKRKSTSIAKDGGF